MKASRTVLRGLGSGDTTWLPDKDDRAEYTFRRAVGTKGSTDEVKVNGNNGNEITDMLQIMEDLARVVASEDPGDDPVLPPWQELEPV